MDNVIDCKGLKCPQPVISTKKYFDGIDQGNATIIVDNEVANLNISKFAQSNGFEFSSDYKDGLYFIKISKAPCNCKIMDFEKNKFLIIISTDKLGLGDDTLGATLMKSYFYALSESDTLPSDILFLNGGVKLTVEGSDSLNNIKALSEKGVNILNCGACLDFYNLKDKLAVGEITNMYTIVEMMNSSSNTIKL